MGPETGKPPPGELRFNLPQASPDEFGGLPEQDALRLSALVDHAKKTAALPDSVAQATFAATNMQSSWAKYRDYAERRGVDVEDMFRQARAGTVPVNAALDAESKGGWTRPVTPTVAKVLALSKVAPPQTREQAVAWDTALSNLSDEIMNAADLPEDAKVLLRRRIEQQRGVPVVLNVNDKPNPEQDAQIRSALKPRSEKGGGYLLSLTSGELRASAGFRVLDPEEDGSSPMGGTDLADTRNLPASVATGATQGAAWARDMYLSLAKSSQVMDRLDEYEQTPAGAQKVIEDAAAEILRVRGIPTAEVAKARGMDWGVERAKALTQATRWLAIARTAGAWTGSVFMPETLNVTDNADALTAWKAALLPQIEVVGTDAAGNALLRQESPWQYGFRLMDATLGATAGVVREAVAGRKGEAPSLNVAAARGVAEGIGIMDVALETPWARNSLVGSALLGGAGLFLDIVFPVDVPVVSASLAQKANVSARKITTAAARSQAARLLDAARDAHQAGARAFAAGNYDEAATQWGHAAAAETKLRETFRDAGLGSTLDRIDADLAASAGVTAMAEDAGFLPGRLGSDLAGRHLSARRAEKNISTGEVVTTRVVPELYNPTKELMEIGALREKLRPLADAERADLYALASSGAEVAPEAEVAVRAKHRAALIQMFPQPPAAVLSSVAPLVSAARAVQQPAKIYESTGFSLWFADRANVQKLWVDPVQWYQEAIQHIDDAVDTKLMDALDEDAANTVEENLRILRDRILDVAYRSTNMRPTTMERLTVDAEEALLLSSMSRASAADVLAQKIRKDDVSLDEARLAHIARDEKEAAPDDLAQITAMRDARRRYMERFRRPQSEVAAPDVPTNAAVSAAPDTPEVPSGIATLDEAPTEPHVPVNRAPKASPPSSWTPAAIPKKDLREPPWPKEIPEDWTAVDFLREAGISPTSPDVDRARAVVQDFIDARRARGAAQEAAATAEVDAKLAQKKATEASRAMTRLRVAFDQMRPAVESLAAQTREADNAIAEARKRVEAAQEALKRARKPGTVKTRQAALDKAVEALHQTEDAGVALVENNKPLRESFEQLLAKIQAAEETLIETRRAQADALRHMDSTRARLRTAAQDERDAFRLAEKTVITVRVADHLRPEVEAKKAEILAKKAEAEMKKAAAAQAKSAAPPVTEAPLAADALDETARLSRFSPDPAPEGPPPAPSPRSLDALSFRPSDTALAAVRAMPTPVVDPAHAIAESRPVDRLRSALFGPGKIRAVARTLGLGAFFGGDQWKYVRHLPRHVRTSILAGVRLVEHGVSDTIRLIYQRRWADLYRYLDGEEVLDMFGRNLSSSGTSTTQFVVDEVRKVWLALNDNDRFALTMAAISPDAGSLDRLPPRVISVLFGGEDTHAPGVVPRLLTGASSRFFGLMPKALEGIYVNPDASVQKVMPRDGLLLGHMFRWAGLDVQDGMSPEDAWKAADAFTQRLYALTHGSADNIEPLALPKAADLLTLIREVYGEEDMGRAAVLFATQARARLVENIWSGKVNSHRALRIGEPVHVTGAFIRWLSGEAVTDAERATAHAVMARYGMSPQFVELADSGFRVPTNADMALRHAINRGLEATETLGKARSVWDAEAGLSGFSAVHRFVLMQSTRGSMFIRARHFLMNTIDHMPSLLLHPDISWKEAAVSLTRLAPQTMVVSLPGVLRTLHLIDMISTDQNKAGGGVSSIMEAHRRQAQRAGDAAAHGLARLLGIGKYRIEVNDVLDGGAHARSKGRPDVIDTADGPISYRDLRTILVEEGVYSEFGVTQVGSAVRVAAESAKDTDPAAARLLAKSKEFTKDLFDFVADVGEAWAERERVGAVVSLIEAGVPPRLAARRVVESLHDYAQSVTPADRHVLVRILLPYWAFTKNNNRLVMNALLSPRGVYTTSKIRRMVEKTPEYLAHVLYEAVYDPYGVDLEAATPEGQAAYWMLRNAIENGMGPPETWPPGYREFLETEMGPMETWAPDVRDRIENGYGGLRNVPLDVQDAMRAIFSGRKTEIHEGDLFRMTLHALSGGRNPGLASAVAPRPDASARPEYRKTQLGLTLPVPASWSQNVAWYYADAQDDDVFLEAYLPEPAITSAFRYSFSLIGAAFTASLMLADEANILPDTGPTDAEETTASINLANVLQDVLSPDFPVVGDITNLVLRADAHPKRISRSLAETLQHLTGVRMRYRGPRQGKFADDRDMPEVEPGWYLPPGLMSAILEITPGFSDLNNALLTIERTEGPGRTKAVSEFVLLLPTLVQAPLIYTSRDTSARANLPRWERSTTAPPTTMDPRSQ